MVNVLAFYSDNLSSNPAEAYSFFCIKLCLKRTKINKKRPGMAHFLKEILEWHKLHYAELKCPDWINKFMGFGTANQSALIIGSISMQL